MINTMKVLKNEFRLVRRDSMLFMMPFFVVYMGVVLHFLMPWLNDYLAAKEIMPGSVSVNAFSYYYPLVMYYMVIITGPQISGMVYAVLILSDKDDQTIKALMVSPLTTRIYIKRRVILSMVTGVLFILALFYMINIDILPFWQMLLIALGGGQTSSLITLLLAIMANNKKLLTI
jgi:fluoroquinolone transport system permease protein